MKLLVGNSGFLDFEQEATEAAERDGNAKNGDLIEDEIANAISGSIDVLTF